MAKKNKPDKLAQDAAAALAAGTSYGKWKALQPVPVKEETPPLPIYNMQKCAFCGCEFIHNGTSKRKYCGDSCREKAYLERKKCHGEAERT